ncbi:DUF2574 family protein [Citrobacter sp. FP75]|uniref:DUF2574 family protein n=1 Tax=Citrobacter sp. FP75 TaxID=1852949 RepID=UPI001BCA3140|nr:DUF2574 family protein [Citrobacter sp. FP75]
MNKNILLGIIVLTYGLSTSLFASDTATLTIDGRVAMPTCSTDIIDTQLQLRCGARVQQLSTTANTMAPTKGVVTEIIAIPDDDSRRVVLNHYD